MKNAHTLPKAELLQLELRPRTWRLMPFGRFRLANAAKLCVGPLSIKWRMPWLPEVARRLHPECFGGEE